MKLRRDKIEKFINERGWKNTYVAAKMGVSTGHFSRMKANTQSVGVKSLKGLAKVLSDENVTIPSFVDLENEVDVKRLEKILEENKFNGGETVVGKKNDKLVVESMIFTKKQ